VLNLVYILTSECYRSSIVEFFIAIYSTIDDDFRDFYKLQLVGIANQLKFAFTPQK